MPPAGLRTFLITYERHVSVGALLAGFAWDSLTLGRADQVFGNIVFTTYLALAGAAILLSSFYRERNRPAPAFLSPIANFAFGNVASGLLIVYGQSGTLEGSWPFFAVLLAFIAGNEFARAVRARFTFHVAAWHALLLAYAAVVTPVILGRMGPLVFLFSVAASVAATSAFLLVSYAVAPRGFLENVVNAAKTAVAATAVFAVLYATNVIPPVPLALTDIGIYHAVERTASGGYTGTYEPPRATELFRPTSQTFTLSAGDPAYCASAVFAPVGLSAGVSHRWERYDEVMRAWRTTDVIPFALTGGREEGYRGYSVKSSVELGSWRCSVETADGRLIGRTTFTAARGTPSLAERTF